MPRGRCRHRDDRNVRRRGATTGNDPDRKYGVARFERLNCLTGAPMPVRVDRLDAYIDAPGLKFVTGQVIRAFVDRDGKARPPVELVVGEMVGKLYVASYDRKSSPPPRVGDFIEAAR